MLELYIPSLAELCFKQRMLADGATMSYNHAYGGAVSFPEEAWAAWYDRWIVFTGGKRFYRYLKNEKGEFIGEIAYHYDENTGGHLADVLILAEYRGRGYGGEALDLLCLAAKENGLTELYDTIAADNPAKAMFFKRGFSLISRTDEYVLIRKEL